MLEPASRHCAYCGARLAGRPPVLCGNCQARTYCNAKPAGGAVIVDGGRYLAVRRAVAPAAGRWGLPGGFCEGAEHPADAALREIREETGLQVILDGLIGLYLDTYLYQGEDAPTLNAYYLATLQPSPQRLVASDDAAEAAWFELDRPPELAFTHLSAVLHDAQALLQPAHRHVDLARA